VRLKVDENISRSGVILLRTRGHDVATVREQGLSGSADESVFDVCVAESRTLITLDRDFGHALRFPPQQSAGIVILELGGSSASTQLLNDRLKDFLAVAAARSVHGELWIVEPGRVRVRLEKDSE
jgi:predicted nuclease of predicted toxin-antitoxin system